MTMDWHRSEPRDVRPFFATQGAETALDQCGIRLTQDGEITKEISFELEDSDLRKLSLAVYPAILNQHLWMPQGLSASDLDLVIIARHSFLKRTELVGRYSLNEQIPEEVEITEEVLRAVGGGRNSQLTLAVVLAEDRDPQPGTPFVRGHWLAKRTFSFRARSTLALFDVRPRTDEQWVANGYPAKTLYAVEYLSGIESGPEEGVPSVAVVHIHADAHSRLVDTKLGDSVQPLLGAEIVASILHQSLADWENLETAPKGSPLETLLKQLGKVEALKLSDLATLVKSKPSRLKALIQSRLDVVQSLR